MFHFFSRRKSQPGRSQVARPGRPLRPVLECLEDRIVPSLSVPAYNSVPGARATLYLNFAGDFESQWGSWTNITTPAFDTDSDPTNFSQSELNAIHDIWQSVAEDY